MNLAGSPSGLDMSPDVGVQSFYGISSSSCWCRLVKGILLTAVWDLLDSLQFTPTSHKPHILGYQVPKCK